MQDPIQLISELRELQSEANHHALDVDEVQRVTQALFRLYVHSAAAASIPNALQGPEIIGQCAAHHHGYTILGLENGHLDEVLFETVPAKVAAGPDIARPIIETTRSLFIWLKQEFQLPEAEEMIDLLGEDAIEELEMCLSEDVPDGPVKSILMDAMSAGVDLSNEQAVEAFLSSRIGPGASSLSKHDSAIGHGFDEWFAGPTVPAKPAPSPEEKRAQQKRRKKNRKSARKARKKNR